MEVIDIAKQFIENFEINEKFYTQFPVHHAFDLKGDIGSNKVLFKDNIYGKIKIDFSKAENCRVFIGERFNGSLELHITGKNSLIYIGNDCDLKNLKLSSRQDNDFIAVGNYVTTTNRNHWMSGQGSGNSKPAIVIGDDCMFSYDILIRNTDAHPIFNVKDGRVLNEPTKIVLIEPHVWIGQNVNILKSVTIGACSIVALGATVTKDIPRFSSAKGIPAISKINKDAIWSRGYSKSNKDKAKYYMNMFI